MFHYLDNIRQYDIEIHYWIFLLRVLQNDIDNLYRKINILYTSLGIQRIPKIII